VAVLQLVALVVVLARPRLLRNSAASRGAQLTILLVNYPLFLQRGAEVSLNSSAPTENADRGPDSERGGGIAASLRRVVRRLLDSFVCRQIAHRINRSMLSPYVLARKPESHWSYNGVPGYSELYRAWTSDNSTNIWDLARFYTLYLNAAHILHEGVQGDIVELGVYRGNSAALLAALAREHSRRLYLFDTFTGFDQRDFTGHDSHRKPGFADTSLERVRKLVGIRDVSYVPGFFPESCNQIELPAEIAIAHLDCDLYEPTKAGLERFYPRVVPGGLIVVHDYSSGFWPGITRAVDEFFTGRPERPVLAPDRSGTVIVRKSH